MEIERLDFWRCWHLITAFVIWSIAAAAFLIIGIIARVSKKPAGFWANTKAPEVQNIKEYNHAVSKLWLIFAALFEIFGVPLLFCKQNSPAALISVFGTVALVLGIMIAYIRTEIKFKK